MSLTTLLTTYLTIQLLIIIATVGLGLFRFFLDRSWFHFSAQNHLKLHYLALASVLILTSLHPLLPQTEYSNPPAKIWSGASLKSFNTDYSQEFQGYLSVSHALGDSVIRGDRVTLILGCFIFMTLIFGTLLMGRALWKLARLKSESYLLRKIGAVRIYAHEGIQVPFTYWWPQQANLILPVHLVTQRDYFKITVIHELQHHRQTDTLWLYAVWLLRALCFCNPAIHLWSRWLNEIQEFACDEALVDQKNVDSQAYARCLVEVAQTALAQKRNPVCATGLLFLSDRLILKRRIQKMLTINKVNHGRSTRWVASLIIMGAMGFTAIAAKGMVQDRRVTSAQAQSWLEKVPRETQFPVVVNDLVLKQLNRYIGTIEGRKAMREALKGMEFHRPVVSAAIKKYGMPEEIMAIPIMESRYKNLPADQNPSHPAWRAAGVWQFIASTAKRFGLQVDDKKDERLDVVLETDIAMRYLKSNFLRFNDWSLAVLAYNMGEEAVQNAIDKTGSRDAWTLIRNGYEGDANYLAKIMAAIIIVNNPDSVN